MPGKDQREREALDAEQYAREYEWPRGRTKAAAVTQEGCRKETREVWRNLNVRAANAVLNLI
jgi:hypothetical protein